MLQTDASNIIFKLAADFVNNTSRHIFLTGKAGTGKTTFLKYVKENTHKRAVIIAPTGVAAINAGGVTMHSFFQLPFGPFVPGTGRDFDSSGNDAVADKHSLLKNIKFNADKRDLLNELELLIIDEVSMVRADMLDAIDTILRYFRKKPHIPFGGVQLLYIGDMYQLPPVVPNNEWDILKSWYESPFFFSAKAIAEAPPLYIELKKIYRQNEQRFIDVLNRVRNNKVSEDDFLLLNKRYQPDFRPAADEKYITLSTHNRMADAINAAELEKLPGKTMAFNGEVTGDFSDKALPTEMSLLLKVGAQVMFIKNDSSGERKYFNGKLATVKKFNHDEIFVTANDDNEELKVEKETWHNIRYSYNTEKDRIDEEELGSFSQYPIRLAWAITIHKSQGLTFEKAIIDAGASFAAGQVYVALSRCTSLHGLVLLSKLYPSAISTDERVIAFAKKEAAAESLQQILQQEQQQYWADTLVKIFDLNRAVDAMGQFKELVPGKKLPAAETALALSHTLFDKAKELAGVAEKFQIQLRQLLTPLQLTAGTAILEDRVTKAIGYFAKSIGEDLLNPFNKHVDSLRHASKVKKYIKEVVDIELSLARQLQKLTKAAYGEIVFCKDASVYEQYYSKRDIADSDTPQSKVKQVKGASQAETLTLFKEGNSISTIALMRQLAESTISGHLSTFVRTGELSVNDLLLTEKINIILPVVEEIGGDAVTPIKEILGEEFSYADIRIVLNHWHWIQQKKVNA